MGKVSYVKSFLCEKFPMQVSLYISISWTCYFLMPLSLYRASKQIQAYTVAPIAWQYDIVNTRKLFFIVEAESN